MGIFGTTGRSARLAACGLAAAASGIAVQAAAGVAHLRPISTGAVILAAAAVLVARVSRRWTLVVGTVVAALGLMNVAEPGHWDVLLGADGVGTAIGKWLLLLGAGAALIASLGGLLGMVFERAAARSHAAVKESSALADSGPSPQAPREPAWPRRLQIAGLLVLAPACAEYLAAYDDSTGDAVRLIGGLVIFSPLYGAPALLIREVCRRMGLGWVGIFLMAAAFGLFQAGVVDQSLFSLDYRHIESWDEGLRGTFIGPLGMSAYNLLNFVGGHVIYSICVPIAVVETFRPSRVHQPWMSLRMLGLVALLWLAASALVLVDTLLNETSHASPYQVVGSLAAVGLLVFVAVRLRGGRTLRADDQLRRSRWSPIGGGTAPSPRTLFLISLMVATLYNVVPPSWGGVTVAVAVLVGMAALLQRASRFTGWTLRHVVAVAAAPLLARAVISFTYFPLVGEVSAVRKYGHSVVFLILVAVLCGCAWRAAADRQPTPSSQARSPAGRLS